MAELDIGEIEALIALFERSSLAEMTLERGQVRLSLKRGSLAGSGSEIAAEPAQAKTAPPPPPSEPEQVVSNGHQVKSPIVGTFYRRPAPELEPYVQVGDLVAPGDTLCLIEAMKVMNEVKAERAGTVTQIACEDAQPVEYGQLLMVIDPDSLPPA